MIHCWLAGFVVGLSVIPLVGLGIILVGMTMPRPLRKAPPPDHP